MVDLRTKTNHNCILLYISHVLDSQNMTMVLLGLKCNN